MDEGNQVPLSTDLSGNLRVNATFSGTLSNNITQWASTNLGAPSAFGTSPGAVNVIGTNSVVYAIKSGTPAALIADGAGNLDVNTQAAVFAAADGAAVPADAAWIGASDGTLLHGLLVESSAQKNLRVSIFQGGNEANVSSNRLLVDPSGTTIAVTQSTSPWVTSDNNSQTQGSTTSGQKGPLVQGAVTTNDPTYTTAQTDPLSLTTTGHLRTQDSAETNANGSTAVPTNAMFIGVKGADGFLHAASSSTNDGHIDVNASFSGTINPGFVADRQVSGSIAATSQVVNASTQGASSVTIRVSGSWTGTLTFQLSTEDGTYSTANAYPMFTGGAVVTTTTANGVWQIPVGGASNVQIFGTTISSGSATISIEVGAGNMLLYAVQPTAANLNATVSGTVTANQGTAGTIGNSWFVKLTDGASAFGTSANPLFVSGTLTNNNAAPGANNVGVLTRSRYDGGSFLYGWRSSVTLRGHHGRSARVKLWYLHPGSHRRHHSHGHDHQHSEHHARHARHGHNPVQHHGIVDWHHRLRSKRGRRQLRRRQMFASLSYCLSRNFFNNSQRAMGNRDGRSCQIPSEG